MINIGNKWDDVLKEEVKSSYFKELMKFLDEAYNDMEIYPPKKEIFNALKYTDFDDVKVVIIGQDPYHGEGEANGLAFSVNKGVKIPPSLRNIFKEINDELGIDNGNNGDLTNWAKNGVLLLNTVLTVEKDKANSHKKKGWEKFTDKVIGSLNDREESIIFLLWGKPAQTKEKLISDRHIILKSPHPSPLSSYRGFFGNGHFKKVNEILKKAGNKGIDWRSGV